MIAGEMLAGGVPKGVDGATGTRTMHESARRKRYEAADCREGIGINSSPTYITSSRKQEAHPLPGFGELVTLLLYTSYLERNGNGNGNTSPTVEDLNAGIRERLEEESARDRSRTARRQATRARLLDYWTQSDTQMLEELIKVFEEKFGVRVELKDKA